MATAIPARLTVAEGRRFGLTVGGALLVIAGLAVPSRLGPVVRAWMGFARRLSRVTTPILLSVIYFVVLTPTGLVMRLFGRRPLIRPPSDPSFWVPRPANARQRADMEHQF